jgi:hypothetical protein
MFLVLSFRIGFIAIDRDHKFIIKSYQQLEYKYLMIFSAI